MMLCPDCNSLDMKAIRRYYPENSAKTGTIFHCFSCGREVNVELNQGEEFLESAWYQPIDEYKKYLIESNKWWKEKSDEDYSDGKNEAGYRALLIAGIYEECLKKYDEMNNAKI